MQLLSDSKHHSNSQKFLRHSGHVDDLHQNIETMFHSKVTDYEPNTGLIHIAVPDQWHWDWNKGRYLGEYPGLDLYCCKLGCYSSEAVNSSIDEVVAFSGSVVVEREASAAGFSTVWVSFEVEIVISVAMKSRFQFSQRFTLYWTWGKANFRCYCYCFERCWRWYLWVMRSKWAEMA